jgi:hypothetical protein
MSLSARSGTVEYRTPTFDISLVPVIHDLLLTCVNMAGHM